MKEHVTTVHCANASGEVMEKVYVVFAENMPASIPPESLPNNWRYGQSDSGYLNSALFYFWFRYGITLYVFAILIWLAVQTTKSRLCAVIESWLNHSI